jgi:hypothetical protein
MSEQSARQLYLDLFEKIVTNLVYRDAPIPTRWAPETGFDLELREKGLDWPSQAHTMVGLLRLRNVRECLAHVIANDVQGDFIETGVWRGGTCIFARAVLKAYGVTDRRVWVADSFQGIPDTGEHGHEMDRALALHESNDVLGVSMATVRTNFERYDLLDDQVRFLPGWFKDTLPTAPVERLAIMRLDGDLHESTMDALRNLYPKLSVGGFAIIDDYSIPACRKAVEEFRDEHDITAVVHDIDGVGVFWQRDK